MKLSSTDRRSDLGISLRPVTDADAPFLLRLYASTRKEELDCLLWPPGQREAFEEMQFRAQTMHYAREWPTAQHCIIIRESAAAGRLYVDRSGQDIQVIDISLLPEYCARGIGGSLFAELIAESETSDRAISLSALRNNSRALAFYQRLGFVWAGEIPTHFFLERKPG